MANTQFEPLEAFQPSGGYKLMPFRFQRWPDGRAFLTNNAGEHLILTPDQFSQFVGGSLPPLFSPVHGPACAPDAARQFWFLG